MSWTWIRWVRSTDYRWRFLYLGDEHEDEAVERDAAEEDAEREEGGEEPRELHRERPAQHHHRDGEDAALAHRAVPLLSGVEVIVWTVVWSVGLVCRPFC